ncbi:UTP--glucose-1-phosphate uridylyltransferase GalU [Pseudomonadales bacterium]|jgi:UTP--glucose-1-phosphate uridylyltransferase|nr:UTP--glucose-1-phosphate uridylyltransferase GalU [Pseudomonadales bacterium]HAF38468.1 UTP--glucose-1-phosphate uridylyltransferase [Gammaproteobacteria bacterium]MDA9282066.1 UTP--glucose-1-phosphate uridylyltransferase GalU [Pseudomonadales bacterium]MDB3985670.1 UTP--glucose-1-phosphate uridylyltransferase GalU [Pseudomonadales bacterium]MDC3328573.1 UTP--glucose-1-phosphate uridylyltransferase GalU [Pseudomonadales bacterium]
MIRKCLFPAAGYGTRFLPATKAMPKEMLPIVNKPLIQYGVEEALSAGLTQIGFVTGRGKRALEDHFDTSYELEHQIAGSSKETLLSGIRGLIEQCSFSYTRQTEMKGLGHAILTGEPLVGDESFAVVLADDFCVHEPDSVLEQMVALHETHGCSIVAVEEVPWEKTASYGIVSGEAVGDDLVRVTAMVEKPDPSAAPGNLAVIGRYILTPDIFEILKRIPPGRNGEIQITDALNEQAKAGQVLAYRFKGHRFDCGSIEGFVAATNYIYRQHYDVGENYPRS